MSRRFATSVAFAGLLLWRVASASAEPVVLFSTLGPSPGYSTESAYGTSDQQQFYMAFQLPVSARVTSITAPVLFARIVSSGLHAGIWESENGLPAFVLGSELDSIFVPPPSDAAPGTVSVLTFTSSAQPILQADTLYFLNVGACCGFDPLFWPHGNAGVEGVFANAFGAIARPSVGPLAAFRIEGEPIAAPVPEPGTLLLAASGLGLIARRARRRGQRRQRNS